VQWGGNSHLPYQAPTNWQNFGKPSYASVAARPATRPPAKSALKKTTEAAKAAVCLAMAALIPSASATGTPTSA
jgi:hypothetical protein